MPTTASFLGVALTVRKCIYTGKDSDAKDRILPDNPFNWANNAPTTKEYKEKKSKYPTELEMQANETFHLLELARNRVIFYEEKLKEIQENIKKYNGNTENIDKIQIEDKITNAQPENTKISGKPKKRDLEIKKAIEEKEIMEDSKKAIEEVLKKRSNLWD